MLRVFLKSVVGFALLSAPVVVADEPLKKIGRQADSLLPPEAIASLIDEVIENHANKVTFALVDQRTSSGRRVNSPTAWVCVANGQPLWVATKEVSDPAEKGTGMTSRALLRAREFVAKYWEFERKSGARERPINWQPKKETLLPAYQAKHFDCEITEVTLVDREKESWAITFKPFKPSTGGQIWLRFQKGSEISAEFGR